MTEPITSIREFYAHALAIERDASASYLELERVFRARGALALADLAASLASAESGHLEELMRRSSDSMIPVLPPGSYKWLGKRSPEMLPMDLACRAASARALLELALEAERNSAVFFEHVATTTLDDNVRMLAREMAAEEAEHVRWLVHALEAPALRLERDRA